MLKFIYGKIFPVKNVIAMHKRKCIVLIPPGVFLYHAYLFTYSWYKKVCRIGIKTIHLLY